MTSSYNSSFTSTPTPPYPSWFPDHHYLHLLPCRPISLVPHPLLLTSCKQHKSTFLFHSQWHISKPIPFKVPIFQVTSLIFTLLLYPMLPAIWRWGFCWSGTKLWNYNLTSELAGCPSWRQIWNVYTDIKINYIYKNIDCNNNLHIIHNNNWMPKLTICTPFSGNDNCYTMMIQNEKNCCLCKFR